MSNSKAEASIFLLLSKREDELNVFSSNLERINKHVSLLRNKMQTARVEAKDSADTIVDTILESRPEIDFNLKIIKELTEDLHGSKRTLTIIEHDIQLLNSVK